MKRPMGAVRAQLVLPLMPSVDEHGHSIHSSADALHRLRRYLNNNGELRELPGGETGMEGRRDAHGQGGGARCAARR